MYLISVHYLTVNNTVYCIPTLENMLFTAVKLGNKHVWIILKDLKANGAACMLTHLVTVVSVVKLASVPFPKFKGFIRNTKVVILVVILIEILVRVLALPSVIIILFFYQFT